MHTKLSKQSKARAIAICKKVKQSNSSDSQWYDMANSIIGYVKQYGQLSFKQANWLCINADRNKLERPDELLDFEAGWAPKENRPPQTDSDAMLKILNLVKEIEGVILRQK